MTTQEITPRAAGSVEEWLTSLAVDGQEASLLPAAWNAGAVLARAREEAAMEALDALSQADEALVLG